MVARWRSARLAFRREWRISAHACRSTRRHDRASNRLAIDGVLLCSRLVTGWNPDFASGQSSKSWLIEVAGGKAAKIDTDNYPDPVRSFDATWSPDSKWVAYSKNLPSRLRAIFIYSLAEKKSYQLSDGMADSISPAFDAGGKYLYFLASTNYGPSTGWLEMSSIDRPVRRAIYLAVLSATEPSPLLPETGDEPPKPAPPPEPAATP